FRVVGKFDSAALSKLIKIDGNPLFEDTMDLVLVPVKSTTDPSVVISEATIMLDDGFDVVAVAEKLAYMLGVAAIANRDGIAMLITWSFEFSIAGFMPYLFPLTITGLMVYVTMASVYQERKREFIVLATLGLDPGNTFQVFIVETLVLGIMAAILGFFGSYILLIVLSYLRIFLGFYGLSSLPFTYAQWSASSVLVALFIGVVVTFLGGYIPAAKAQGLSLLGRRRTRQFLGELISYNDITRFNLPIKETIQNSEILYTYIRETIGKFKPSRVDPHSIKGEIRRDGSFSVSFTAFSGARGVFIPCEIKGVKDGESLGIVLEFPTKHRQYEKIRVILRDLERYMIGFAAWKEIQLRMKIIREAPRRRKTLEEIMSEVKEIINQIKDCNRKLKILEAQKNQLSEEVYDEFRQKYISRIEEISKGLRSSVVNLEPYYNELQEEIKKVEIEIERITTAHNLGEITEEEYIKTGSPLQARHAALKGRINELEEIFEFLRMPSRIT
ncbi:MAG: FtsX-like permease family protein, partial [Candidatus Bathyarchaeia archaeon]